MSPEMDQIDRGESNSEGVTFCTQAKEEGH